MRLYVLIQSFLVVSHSIYKSGYQGLVLLLPSTIQFRVVYNGPYDIDPRNLHIPMKNLAIIFGPLSVKTKLGILYGMIQWPTKFCDTVSAVILAIRMNLLILEYRSVFIRMYWFPFLVLARGLRRSISINFRGLLSGKRLRCFRWWYCFPRVFSHYLQPLMSVPSRIPFVTSSMNLKLFRTSSLGQGALWGPGDGTN